MADNRQSVLSMISQVKARLTDLEKAVNACEGDLTGYAEKLDRIDDKVYLLEVEILKMGEGSGAASPAGQTAESSQSSAAKESDGDFNIDTDKLKEDAEKAASELSEIYVESKETLTDLKDAIEDITGTIKDSPLVNNPIVDDLRRASKAGKFKRRRW